MMVRVYIDPFLTLLAVLTVAKTCWSATRSITGEVMTFVDFNYDRLTDLVILTSDSELTLYAAVVDSERFQNASRLSLNLSQSGSPKVVNVVGSDFDGDSNLDLAVYWRLPERKARGEVNVTLYWGTAASGEFRRGNQTLPFSSQPSLVDCNLDGLPDLLGEVLNNEKFKLTCIGIVNREKKLFGNLTFPAESHLWNGQAAAFVDVTGNSIPDVVLMVNDSKGITPTFEVWSVDENTLQWVLDAHIMPDPFTQETDRRLMSFKTPKSYQRAQIGQPIYSDFDGDGRIDQLIPVCDSLPCSRPSFYVWSNGTWHFINLDLKSPSGSLYSFFSYSPAESSGHIDEQMTLRSGDIDQNGFPDLVVPMFKLNDSKNSSFAFILENSPCRGLECDEWTRTFRVKWDPMLYDPTNVTSVAFVDLKEDGLLDLMIEVISTSGTKETFFVLTEDTSDTCFVKVEVYTYTCLSDCTAASKRDNIGNVAEGSIIPLSGATLWIQRTSPEGDTLFSAAGLLPQAAFRPLALPYVTFGLDRTTNFVEKLKVSIPHKTSVSHSWSQIIPNSRLYIVPYPPDRPDLWVSRLYVTPSRLILLSLAALASVCAVILVVIAALHYVEKRADRKEKRQDAQKFHFDAM